MELKVFPLLSTNSKRAMLRGKTPRGRKRTYVPQHDLMDRLQATLGMTADEIIEQAAKERRILNP